MRAPADSKNFTYEAAMYELPNLWNSSKWHSCDSIPERSKREKISTIRNAACSCRAQKEKLDSAQVCTALQMGLSNKDFTSQSSHSLTSTLRLSHRRSPQGFGFSSCVRRTNTQMSHGRPPPLPPLTDDGSLVGPRLAAARGERGGGGAAEQE